MKLFLLLASFVIGSSALHAAPLPLKPLTTDMTISVVDDGNEKGAKQKKKKAGKKGKGKKPLADKS